MPFSLTFPWSPSLGAGSSWGPRAKHAAGLPRLPGMPVEGEAEPGAQLLCHALLLAGCGGEHGGQAGAWSHASDPDGQLRRVATLVSAPSAGLSPSPLLQIRLLGVCGAMSPSLCHTARGGPGKTPSKLIRASPPTSPPPRGWSASLGGYLLCIPGMASAAPGPMLPLIALGSM